MANPTKRNTIIFARNIVPVFFAVTTIIMIINIIIIVVILVILTRLRSSVCDTSRADEREQTVSESEQSEPLDEPVYNITSNKYSYAYCSNKHCIQIGSAIYFAGEITPFGKLLTATPTRLICEVSPTEYNVVYRIY